MLIEACPVPVKPVSSKNESYQTHKYKNSNGYPETPCSHCISLLITYSEGISSLSKGGEPSLIPRSSRQGLGAIAQRMHLALSGPSISRKRHESVMSSAMNSNMGSGPKRSPTLSENASRPGRPPPSAPIRSAQLSSLAELANQVPQASTAAPDDDTEDLTAQSAMSAPDRDLEAQAPQANTVTS